MTFSGRTVRAVSYKRGRVNFEQFFLIMGEALALPDSRHLGLFGRALAKSAELVDSYDFADEPKSAPALVYERRIASETSTGFLENYFRGSGPPAVSRGLQLVDLGEIEPMSVANFWDIVEGARHADLQAAKLSISSIGDRLAALPDTELLAFQHQLARVLAAIDHPANVVRHRREAGGFVVSADASLYLRCRIVLAGRGVYEALLHSPGAELLPGDAAGGEELLAVVADVLRARGHGTQFTGGPSYETGDNTDAWGVAPTPPPSHPEALVDAVASRQTTLDLIATYRHPVVGDPWFDARQAFGFYTARFALKTVNGFAERLYLYPIRFDESPMTPLAVLAKKLSKTVLEVDGPREANALAIPGYGLLLHAIFRPGWTIDEYRDRIVAGLT
jgi:hypothetical protein